MTASVYAGVWDLTPADRLLVEARRWGNRLRFAVMLLFFRARGRFPRTMAVVDEDAVAGLSNTLPTKASRKNCITRDNSIRCAALGFLGATCPLANAP